ncbi:MAG: hypothetical protein M3Q28_10450 [Pseudomonadota bacterium]|nr:hypothetical protein [Pseudomonadota bacterium]
MLRDYRRDIRVAKSNFEVLGFWHTFKTLLIYFIERSLGRLSDDSFDKKHGVSTSGNLTLEQLGIDDPYSIRYVPTHERVMEHVLRNLDIDHSEYVFVDLGCGKGRAVLMAMAFPFEEVIGVELSSVTSAIAEKNVEIFKFKGLQRCRSVRISCENAMGFKIPDSNVVFYLYRPFTGPVIEKVIDNICEAASKSSCRFLIAHSCVSPEVNKLLRSKSGLVETKEYETMVAEHSWSLWEYKKAH